MKIYHLSKSRTLKTLTPRVPNNYMTKHGYEDGKTERVCFSESIDGSLMAIHEKKAGEIYFVYEPVGSLNDYNIKYSQYVKTKVPDADITKEVWVLDKVPVKITGIIKLIGDAMEDGIKYTYGKNRTAELYKWKWKYIGKR